MRESRRVRGEKIGSNIKEQMQTVKEGGEAESERVRRVSLAVAEPGREKAGGKNRRRKK